MTMHLLVLHMMPDLNFFVCMVRSLVFPIAEILFHLPIISNVSCNHINLQIM